ncbi:hypothetical protein M432DRAFT_228999 [Thermoascus aurantiacus ATCC 26904]
MATDPFYTIISSEIENDKSELLKMAKELKPVLQESEVETNNVWTPYTARLIKGHPAKRLIVFRPRDSKKLLGCIRVYKSGTTVQGIERTSVATWSCVGIVRIGTRQAV